MITLSLTGKLNTRTCFFSGSIVYRHFSSSKLSTSLCPCAKKITKTKPPYMEFLTIIRSMLRTTDRTGLMRKKKESDKFLAHIHLVSLYLLLIKKLHVVGHEYYFDTIILIFCVLLVLIITIMRWSNAIPQKKSYRSFLLSRNKRSLRNEPSQPTSFFSRKKTCFGIMMIWKWYGYCVVVVDDMMMMMISLHHNNIM